MNGRSDASTSTDDVKGRPLCLFYFSQPLGVVAAEPPRAAPCPPHLYRPPYCSHSPPTYPFSPPAPGGMAPAWDSLWAPASPIPSVYVSGSSAEPRRDTLSSSLFSNDTWFPPSASPRDLPRRIVPYHALLPPLRLPAPRAPAPPDAWPLRVVQPERFSLPPIELPAAFESDQYREMDIAAAGPLDPLENAKWEVVKEDGASSVSRVTRLWARAPGAGVHKPRRRARTSALRRSLTHLIQRGIKGSLLSASGRDSAASCCVRAALRTLRAAWPPSPPSPPPPLHHRADTAHDCQRLASPLSSPCTWCASASSPVPARCPAPAAAAPAPAMPHAEPAPGASPGLLRRRYSVPETIMRKYRLAQQSNDAEEPCAATSPSSSSAACYGRGVPPDREVMRKSALLRRLWGRAPPPALAQRTSRSLHGSSSELRRSPAGSGWATPKRQRLDWTPRPGSPPVSPCSDCTFLSHRPRSPVAPVRDVFARYSHLAEDAARSPPPAARSSPDSATLSESLPTALPAGAPVAEVEVDRYTSLPFDVLPIAGSPPYEVLEIVVSETVEAPRASEPNSPAKMNTGSSPTRSRPCNINIDEYVSNILVESLNSLSEQLENMSAAVGGAGVVVEKEIKVRLQNTGVNTIVHLSPTSNHQIIFGNEELCHTDNEKRDSCNNPPLPSLPSPPSPAPEPNNNEPVDSVNRAVLQQIQKLFHDELYRLEPGPYPGEPTLTQIESSNVDAYIEHHTDSQSDSPSLTGLGVGAGNYWTREPALVPRLSALPHSASMEVNTSSSEAEPSACPSLVDSLDDPTSPRVPPPARRLQRSGIDMLELLPEAPPTQEKPEAFFVRITDEDCDCDKENVVVADRMPDRIRERLLRRHRKRELRMESRRCGGPEKTRRRAADHDARAIIAILVDELVAKIAQEEYKYIRIQRQQRADRNKLTRNGGNLIEEHNGRIERALHGKLSLPPPDAPRRFYQKSEIHDGDKCIEILEILEYVDENSAETTNSDEHQSNSKNKKSRIPIPIYERIQRTTKRVSNSVRPRSPPPPPSPSPPLSARRASVPPPADPRGRAGSLRFHRVFDMIPEERSAGLAESPPAPDDAPARRVSAPSLPPAPRSTRSAATSPPAPQRASRSTMTSPRRAAPSPSPAPRVAAGGNGTLKEKKVATESERQKGSAPGRFRSAHAQSPALPAPVPVAATSRETRSSSSGSDSGGSSLLCAAPRWLAARRRRPRHIRAAHTSRAAHRVWPASRPDMTGGAQSKAATPPAGASGGAGGGGWSVTVAGSCRAALPADVEMRLRFPRDPRAAAAAAPRAPPRQPAADTPRRSVATRSDETGTTECWCRCCSCGAGACGTGGAAGVAGAGGGAAAGGPHAPALPPPPSRRASLTFTMKKEDRSALNRRSRKKCSHTHLPQLEAAAAGGSGGGGDGPRRRSGKMRRACSLQCWLPAAAAAAAPRRAGELAVEGSAIVPELKPRAPTMSERDLTRHHTPRLYLRC